MKSWTTLFSCSFLHGISMMIYNIKLNSAAALKINIEIGKCLQWSLQPQYKQIVNQIVQIVPDNKIPVQRLLASIVRDFSYGKKRKKRARRWNQFSHCSLSLSPKLVSKTCVFMSCFCVFSLFPRRSYISRRQLWVGNCFQVFDRTDKYVRKGLRACSINSSYITGR